MKTLELVLLGGVAVYAITRPSAATPSAPAGSSVGDFISSALTAFENSGIASIGNAINGATATVGNTTFTVGASSSNNTTMIIAALAILAVLVMEE